MSQIMWGGIHRKSKILFMLDALLMNSSVTLTSGLFLSGFIIFINGNDFFAGLLNNVQVWGAAFALFAFLIYERKRQRKKLLILIYAVSRLMACGIVFLPAVSNNKSFQLYMLAAMIIISNIVYNACKVGMSVWVVSLLEPEHRGSYMYYWEGTIRIAFTFITLLMGFVLDVLNKTYVGFLIVFIAALALSVIDIVVLLNIHEPENVIDCRTARKSSALFEPLKNVEYKTFLIFVFLFYLTLSMASSYTYVFLLKYLNVSYGLISVINVMKVIFMILFSRFWSNIGRKKGTRFTLVLSALIGAVEFSFYGFLNSNTIYLLLISSIFAGIGFSGFKAAIVTYRYDMMPETNRTVYEGWFIALQGLSSFIAPFAGGVLLKNLPVINNTIFQHSNFQLLFIISFVCVVCVTLAVFYGPALIAKASGLKSSV